MTPKTIEGAGRLIPADQIKLSAVWRVPPGDRDEAHGFGGQHVGTTRVLRVEHEPTGTVIYIADGQSQHRQREVALDAMEFIVTHPAFRLRPVKVALRDVASAPDISPD